MKYDNERKDPISRKLLKREDAVIIKLERLMNRWPKSLQIISNNGSLVVVDHLTGQVFAYIYGIPNDGGDDANIIADENGVEWLEK